MGLRILQGDVPVLPGVAQLGLAADLALARLGGEIHGGRHAQQAAEVGPGLARQDAVPAAEGVAQAQVAAVRGDRKSTRLNSSHVRISYAVFCLKKKKKIIYQNYAK